MNEASTNWIFRRADWRFLLPDPWANNVACYASGALKEAVATVFDLRSSVEPGNYDLIVVKNPSIEAVRQAWEALRPGGVLYGEWSCPGVRKIRNKLLSAGFIQISFYWAWPSPERAQFWIPLTSSQAVRYLLRSRSTVHPRLRAPFYWSRITAWNILSRSGMLWPLCVVAHKPTAGEPDSLLPRQLIREAVRSTDLQLDATPVFNWLLLAGGPRSDSKSVGLVFTSESEHPCLAVKMVRTPDGHAPLRHEASILKTVHERNEHRVSGIPRVLFFQEEGPRLRFGQSAHTGYVLFNKLNASTFSQIAREITTWLSVFAGTPAPSPREIWWDKVAGETIEQFGRSYAMVVDPGMLSESIARINKLSALPLVLVHGDFSPWNLLLSDEGGIAVLDWETAQSEGLPLRDLVYCFARMSFWLTRAVRTGRRHMIYRDLLDPSTEHGRLFHECQTDYAAAVGLQPSDLHPLRLLTWLIHANTKMARLKSDGVEGATCNAIRASISFQLWQEELKFGR